MFKSLTTAIVVSLLSISTFAYSESGRFPKGPDATLTPGDLCHDPDEHRYPEGIAYCERNVSTDTKRAIFVKYDQLGYRTREMKRTSFKIDHYIPLCMGGSNHESNLWPQHESIYNITDPLEPLLCEKMAQGRLTQKKAVEYIVYGKNNLSEVRRLIKEIEKL